MKTDLVLVIYMKIIRKRIKHNMVYGLWSLAHIILSTKHSNIFTAPHSCCAVNVGKYMKLYKRLKPLNYTRQKPPSYINA